MNRFEDLTIAQLDERLSRYAEMAADPLPKGGWVRTVREALGMSIRQLAERTGLSKTSVASIETSESNGKVQLDSLMKLAEGLNCEVVYALVPRTSLRAELEKQAGTKAEALVNRVSDSMELEGQGVPGTSQQKQVSRLKEELIRKRGRDFWNV